MNGQIRNLLVCTVCFATGFLLKAVLEIELLTDFVIVNSGRIVLGLISFAILFGVSILLIFSFAKRLLARRVGVETNLSEKEIVAGLVDYVSTPEGVRNPTPEERRRAAIVNLGLWWARRGSTQFYAWLVVTILGGLIGSATLLLLYEQNEKLDTQNSLLTDQNKKITDQNTQIRLQTQANIANAILLEGTRRAALSQRMNDLFREIGDEVDAKLSSDTALCSGPADYGCYEELETPTVSESISTKYRLSQRLFRKVQAFANESTPYHVAISANDRIDMNIPLEQQFNFVELSPERGLLLQTIALNAVDPWRINLSRANLSRANLIEPILEGANMEAVYLRSAYIFRAKLQNAHLQNSDFSDAEVVVGDLSFANLTGTNFTNSVLIAPNLEKTNFSNAVFTGASITDATGLPWAWSDQQPTGLNEGNVEIQFCKFRPGEDKRNTIPFPCQEP